MVPQQSVPLASYNRRRFYLSVSCCRRCNTWLQRIQYRQENHMKLMVMYLSCVLCVAGFQAQAAQAKRRTCEPALTKFGCTVIGGLRSTVGEALKPGFKGEEGIERWKQTIYREPRRAPKAYRRPERGPTGGRTDQYGFYGDP
jgi:hypothetical protein